MTGCPCGEANHLDRIVNGEVTERDEYPWQVRSSTGNLAIG